MAGCEHGVRLCCCDCPMGSCCCRVMDEGLFIRHAADGHKAWTSWGSAALSSCFNMQLTMAGQAREPTVGQRTEAQTASFLLSSMASVTQPSGFNLLIGHVGCTSSMHTLGVREGLLRLPRDPQEAANSPQGWSEIPQGAGHWGAQSPACRTAPRSCAREPRRGSGPAPHQARTASAGSWPVGA